MHSALRLAFTAAALSCALAIAHAVQTPTFFCRGGTLWVSGQQNELSFQRDGEPPQIVWKNEIPLQDGVQVGARLVFSNWDTLTVFPSDSWTPRVTTLPSAVTALAASADTAVAFTNGSVWRLKPDGTWSQHPTGIKDHIIALAHHRGTWVAVGSTLGESVSPDDAGPDQHNWPHWELNELTRRIYWSADGLKWQPAQLPPPAEGDPYGQIVAVAGNTERWLALGAEGDAYTSKDGRSWQPAERLSDITPNTQLRLHALGQRFWAQVTNEEYSHSWHTSTDGQNWSPVPLVPGASITALFMKSSQVHALGTRRSGRGYETAPVAAFGEIPPPNEAELAAAKAIEDKARAAAEAALAAKKAAEEKALAETQARERKLQSIAANLTDVSGVFQGTANGIHWDGTSLLVSAYGGIYRSTDGAKFDLWIPSGRIGFQGLRQVAGRLWAWSGSPIEGRSELSGFPPNAGAKLPTLQTATGRITGLAGDGDKLAFITDAGSHCYIYTSDDGGKRWSFSPVKAGDLMPMQYGPLPNMVGPGLAYGNGRWVAIGRRADNKTVAAVSTDRVNWKLVPVGGPDGGMMRIVFAHDRFVASGNWVSGSGTGWTVARSPDGETWELSTLAGERPGLVDVAGGRLYAHNRTGLFTSDDARTWRRIATHAPLDAVTLQEIGGKLVLVGEPVTEGRANEPKFQLVQLPALSSSEIAARPDTTTETVALALEKFDRAALAASTPAGFARPAAELVTALDHLTDRRLADAFCGAAAQFLYNYGGAQGYFEWLMALSEPRMQTAAKLGGITLTPAQKEIVRGLATRVNQPSVAVDTRGWQPSVRKPAAPQASEALALPQVRRAVASGRQGAVFDLVLAHSNGMGTPKDDLLAHLWVTVFNRLMPALPKDDFESQAALAAAGSAFYLGLNATSELTRSNNRLTEALLADLERGAAGGSAAAKLQLALHAATIKARRESGLTFAQFYAREQETHLAAMKTLQQTLAQVPAAEIDRMVAAMAAFDTRSYAPGGDYQDWCLALAAFVTAMDAAPNQPLADAVRLSALNMAANYGGAVGFARFYDAIPAARRAAVLAELAPARRAWVEKRSAPPADWQPKTRTKPGTFSADQYYDAKVVRTALARGWHGAAFDVYSFGDDEAVNQFWGGVGASLIPAAPQEKNEAKLTLLMADYGCAAAFAQQALDLAQTKGSDAPEVRTLRQRAAAAGRKEAVDAGAVLVSDEAMGLGPEALERALAELRASGMSDADIAEMERRSSERQAALQADLKAQGMSAQDIGAAMNAATTEVLRDQARDLAKMPQPDLKQAAGATAIAAATETKAIASARIAAESAGTGEGGVRPLRLPGITQSLGSVHFVNGLYVAASEKGTLFFSGDGLQWEAVALDGKSNLTQVLHDGDTWIATTGTGAPGYFSSKDRKTWTSHSRPTFANRALVARRGQYWSAGSLFKKLSSYHRGEFSSDVSLKEWDGQIGGMFNDSPRLVWESAGRIYLMMEKGRLMASDQGEYWEEQGRFSVERADKAHFAEGNGATLLALVRFGALENPFELHLRRGDAPWKRVELPFKDLNGLAYGRGRFVALGGVMKDGQWALYESTDGETWTRIGGVRTAIHSLTFGPAGFVTSGFEGGLVLYAPAPLPEKPMPPRVATSIPPVSFPYYATGDAPASTGKGRGPRTLSPEERATDALRSLVPKAEAGDIAAKRTLAFAMSPGGGAASNPWRAELWFKEALAAGDPQAGRGYARLLRQWKPDTPAARIEELYQLSAERGDEPAATWIAQRRTYSEKIAQAKAGDPAAIMAVAPLLIAGDVVDADRTRALNLVYTAAEKNHAPALRFILQNHADELAAKVAAPRRILSDATYLKFLGQLAATGDLPALRALANGHVTGANGIPKDDALAYATALKLAQLDDTAAMTFVGGALIEGRGVAQDAAAGRTWITQAAEKGDAGAQQWLAQQAAVVERAKTRPPLDGRVNGVAPEVLAALELIQSAAAAELADADSWTLAKAVWADAEYSIVEEDLAQELAGAARPLAIKAGDGRTVTFTKKIPSASAAGFAQVFPVAYQPGNTNYHTVLWQRTSSAGVLVALARQSAQTKAQIQQGIAQDLWGMLNQPAPKDKQAILAFSRQLKESDGAASPAVQKEFRAILRAAYQQARLAAQQTGKSGFIGLGQLPWD